MSVRKRVSRHNIALLPWLRAIGFAVLVLIGLGAMPFFPKTLVPVIALGVSALSLFVPAVAVLAVVVALSIPLMAADLAVGIVFLLIGLSASQYLGQDNARAFLMIGFAFAASVSNAAWALAIIAGFAFGASEGAIMALLACLAIEGIGLVSGREAIGILATGGTSPGLVDFTGALPGTVTIEGVQYSALGFKWLAPAFGAIDPAASLRELSDLKHLALLIAQPIIWAVAAGVTGSLTRSPQDPKRRQMGFVSVAVGCAAVIGASAAAIAAVDAPIEMSAVASGGAIAFAACVVFVAVSEFIFTPQVVEKSLGAPSLHAEDADVDELLRVISSAEDELAAKHTIDATVLITDMKSFSAMTEMDGSVITAKTIQRHRDLLLPVIARHEGSGKSTGGDGLLAAFARAGDAVTAAVEMQRVLVEFNAAHPAERPMSVRVGMADGEVVVDKHGRPFIGDALNRAARIMDLADGGQIFATRSVMNMTPAAPPSFDHGDHSVKNIKEPLKVVEILWTDGLEPKPPIKMADRSAPVSEPTPDDTGAVDGPPVSGE